MPNLANLSTLGLGASELELRGMLVLAADRELAYIMRRRGERKGKRHMWE